MASSCERDLPKTVAATSNVSRLTCPTFNPLLVHQHCAFTPCCAWGVRLRLRRAAALCLYSGSGVARPSWGGLTDWFAAKSLVFAICVLSGAVRLPFISLCFCGSCRDKNDVKISAQVLEELAAPPDRFMSTQLVVL
jgi:hypothetical protein